MAQKSVYRALLIDDDKEEFLILRDLLSDLSENPIRIEWVSDFETAKSLIRKNVHDVYLVDYRLGARTGLDLISEVIKSSLVPLAPFILLTGFGDHEIDLSAMASGASDYLVKSQLSGPLLERAIRYAVNQFRVTRELREGEERVRNLFDASFGGILVLDENGTILDANSNGVRLFSDRRIDVIGENVRNYLPAETVRSILENKSNNQLFSVKTILVRSNGKNKHVEVSAKPYNHGGSNSILIECNDISDRVNMEAQILMQDRLASIGLLASSLAHEIGTPLGVMRGRAELILMHRPADESIAKNATVIVEKIDRVSKLIRSLLALARGEKSGVAYGVDAGQVVREVVELLSHELRSHRIECVVSIPGHIMVKAESGPLHQVILNLLVNAIHAINSATKKGRAGPHEIHIAAVNTKTGVALSIRDTGTGISPANLKQLFKPFFTTKDIGEGTGLGLATCFRIVHSWEGSIQVETEEGVGTCFILSLANPA